MMASRRPPPRTPGGGRIGAGALVNMGMAITDVAMLGGPGFDAVAAGAFTTAWLIWRRLNRRLKGRLTDTAAFQTA